MAESEEPQKVIRDESAPRPAYYGHRFEIGATAVDFRIRAFEILEASTSEMKIRELACFYMHPAIAKEVSKIFSDKIAEYEQRFGPIKLPEKPPTATD